MSHTRESVALSAALARESHLADVLQAICIRFSRSNSGRGNPMWEHIELARSLLSRMGRKVER